LQFAANCGTFYIADLDAIEGTGTHRSTIQKLAAGLAADLWVDAGVTDLASARQLLNAGARSVIVGSETLPGLAALHAIRSALDDDQLLFSLDVKQGRVLSRCTALSNLEPLAAIDLLAQAGWRHLIILSLEQVGTGSGPDWPLLRAARTAFPCSFLVAGGGVRSIGNLHTMNALGIDGVLIASALHRGWITRRDLQTLPPAQ
jgi:phosphoribosylformimino-5-aminoimidazole carboxamide ribotide isomerase